MEARFLTPEEVRQNRELKRKAKMGSPISSSYDSRKEGMAYSSATGGMGKLKYKPEPVIDVTEEAAKRYLEEEIGKLKFEGRERFHIEIYRDNVNIRHTCDSEPEFSFEILSEISRITGTRKINFDKSMISEGCETCGYGSSWEFAITCSKVNFYIPTLNVWYRI